MNLKKSLYDLLEKFQTNYLSEKKPDIFHVVVRPKDSYEEISEFNSEGSSLKVTHTVIVKPKFAPEWSKKGWKVENTLEGMVFRGEYRIEKDKPDEIERFPGRMIKHKKIIETYITNPPPYLITSHVHKQCFNLIDAGGDKNEYKMHWKVQPSNIDTAIIYMEKLIKEALEGKNCK